MQQPFKSDTEIDLLRTVKNIYKNSKIVHRHSLDMDDHILSLTEIKTHFHCQVRLTHCPLQFCCDISRRHDSTCTQPYISCRF